ncbi:MAG TPA: nucleotide exchange factor GrpE [Pyrinomonadaceae bacterium]|nr:nucleotide exchange factor GrpE [Pyrinomonadaceae bacterium]
MLLLLALAFHAFHLLRSAQLSQDVQQMRAVQKQLMVSGGRGSAPPGKNPAIEKLTEQVQQQAQGMGQVSARMGQLEERIAASNRRVEEAVQAVALTANWVGQSQLKGLAATDGAEMSEQERAAMIATLERYKEPLRLNAGRVEPVAQVLAAFVEKIESRPFLSPEFVSRVQGLYQEIGQFDQWHMDTSEKLAALQRGSFSKRNSMFQADQHRLVEQVESGNLSIAQMIERSRTLLDQHFPTNARGNGQAQSVSVDEADLKRILNSAPDYLMDWYNNFFQLQSQVTSSQVASIPVDVETINEMAQIQRVAREALGKFDIQPEEIQVGQTGFDRRLHEATLVRQSTQYPSNTVIEVHRCGFRRMSTGEVLRRPQVVVAGASV